MNLGLGIRKIRTDKGLLQGELAKKCKISQTSLYQIEKGLKRPSGKTLEIICKKLEIPETLIYLYALEESDIPEKKKESFRLFYPVVEEMIRKFVTME